MSEARLSDPPAVPLWLKLAGTGAITAALAALCLNAATMTFCEDEANGFYLSKQPLGELLGLLSSGYHEDPPLSDVILHAWIPVAGFRPWLLRAVPVAFWMLALPGLFLVGRRLLGPRGGWLTLLAVGLLPYHWTIPGVFRWYSLYACLAVWNFWCFLHLLDAPAGASRSTARRSALYAVGYVLTGAALWYTNYSAPILFFSHMVIAPMLARGEAKKGPGIFCRNGPKGASHKTYLVPFSLCWLAIGLLFLPWLPTFLGQLGRSARPLSPSYTALSFWVLWAGELASPFDLHAAAPAVVGAVAFAVLGAMRFRRSGIPGCVVAVALVGLLATGAIGPKRLLIVSPFLALALAAALGLSEKGSDPLDSRGLTPFRIGAERRTARRRFARAGLAVSLACALVAVAAVSWVNLVRRSGWVAYRWLDPCSAAVQRVRARAPGALVVSNSNPVFFYLKDEYGKNLCRLPQEQDPGYRPAAMLFPLELNYAPRCREALREAQRVAWIYHSPYHGPISGCYGETGGRLARYGFRPAEVEPLLRPASGFLRHHPRFGGRAVLPADDYRMVVVYFEKDPVRIRVARQPP